MKCCAVFGAPGMSVYEVQCLVTGEMRNAHVARMRFYADKQLEVTSCVTKKMFQCLEHQVRYHIERIGKVKKAECGDEYVLARTGE